jgi:uncharacterized protein with NRDE domain
MCTVSWFRHEGGYFLTSNRDERYTRKRADGPFSNSLRGVSYIAPIDGDHGGSWIGVNEFGLTLCLLNRYRSSPAGQQLFTSRGLLLTNLIDCHSASEVIERLSASALETFRPFTMLVVGVIGETNLFEWTGATASARFEVDALCPLISSSFSEPEVHEHRIKEFQQLLTEHGSVDETVLDRFHRSHRPEAGPFSVCMHRADAATMSMSTVKVGPDGVEFRYQPGSPCSGEDVKIVTLPLSQSL